MRRKKNQKIKKKSIFWIFLLIISLLLIFWILRFQFRHSWSGREQISFGLSLDNGEVSILTLTPAKDMVTETRLASNLLIGTPWFGNYTVDKLFLLVDQENNENIFNRSLSYYLGIGVDFGFQHSKFENFSDFFFPPKSLTFWRAWRYLNRKDLVWKKIDLSNFSQSKLLPDGSEVLVINSDDIGHQLRTYFTDPVIIDEGLTLSVFNAGGKSGTARKVAGICQNMGIRVIEVGDEDKDIDDCRIFINEEDIQTTFTIKRLQRLFGCQVEVNSNQAISDIKLVIKNVKID